MPVFPELPHAPFAFADFALDAFAVTNRSREYDYMLNLRVLL